MKIPLVARSELTHDGEIVACGEVFEADPLEAAVLRYKRQVDFAPRGVRLVRSMRTPLATIPPEHEATGCLVGAANPPEATGLPGVHPCRSEMAEDEPNTATKKPKPRRRYQRRDLEPEE